MDLCIAYCLFKLIHLMLDCLKSLFSVLNLQKTCDKIEARTSICILNIVTEIEPDDVNLTLHFPFSRCSVVFHENLSVQRFSFPCWVCDEWGLWLEQLHGCVSC